MSGADSASWLVDRSSLLRIAADTCLKAASDLDDLHATANEPARRHAQELGRELARATDKIVELEQNLSTAMQAKRKAEESLRKRREQLRELKGSAAEWSRKPLPDILRPAPKKRRADEPSAEIPTPPKVADKCWRDTQLEVSVFALPCEAIVPAGQPPPVLQEEVASLLSVSEELVQVVRSQPGDADEQLRGQRDHSENASRRQAHSCQPAVDPAVITERIQRSASAPVPLVVTSVQNAAAPRRAPGNRVLPWSRVAADPFAPAHGAASSPSHAKTPLCRHQTGWLRAPKGRRLGVLTRSVSVVYKSSGRAAVAVANAARVPQGTPCRCAVRGKEDRLKLQVYDCERCRKFYSTMGIAAGKRGGQPNDAYDAPVQAVGPNASRHRLAHAPTSTPPGFWDLSFPRKKTPD